MPPVPAGCRSVNQFLIPLLHSPCNYTLRHSCFYIHHLRVDCYTILKANTADEINESAGRGLHVGSCDDELVKFGAIVKDIVMCLVMNADR